MANNNQDPVAFFCCEFGIDNDLPTYAGGLGILSGDLMNQAADSDFPMVGIGILYKGKQFLQHITADRRAETRDSEFDHDSSFLRQTTKEGKPLILTIDMGGTNILVKSYHIKLGDRTTLYFLSTDVDGNPNEWVSDMDCLYQGDMESQIRQQILLGVGGVKLLDALGINPLLYHINEGRPSFIIFEIVKKIMSSDRLSFEKAFEKAREKIVYTNHTLVAAGNLNYPRGPVEKLLTPLTSGLGINLDEILKHGLLNQDTFSITLFALNISKKHSAVSKIHAEAAKKDWPNHSWIAITNGVNMARWQDSDFRRPNLSDRELWDLHLIKKKELVETVKERTGFSFDHEKLVITWARRLAEYKQPKIIFENLQRLKDALSKTGGKIQFLFSGNSHTGDPTSKSIIEEIIKLFATELSGMAIFIPNYNISLANHLTSGSDIWLNTPKGNLEACGTSGMKAISNGVLHCTVLDGWTYEVNWKDIGWTLDPQNVSESFYKILEEEIVPLYYQRNQDGLPIGWIERIRKSISTSKDFSTERMLSEYKQKLYS